jgi:hypothetical protein
MKLILQQEERVVLVVQAQINNLLIVRFPVFIFLLVLIGCGPKKSSIDFPNSYSDIVINKSISSDKIDYENLNLIDFPNLILSSTANLEYNNNNYGFDLNLRFSKGNKMLVSGSLILPIFKVLIERDKVLGYQKVDRTFFEASFTDIRSKLGVELNYSEIENLFLGNPVLDLKSSKGFKIYKNDANMLIYNIDIDNVAYNMIFDSKSNKLLGQEITQLESKRYLKIFYNSFQKINDFDLPCLVSIIINDGKNLIKLTISTRSKEVSNQTSFPFKIPTNYRKTQF